jgi:hypothetical protein
MGNGVHLGGLIHVELNRLRGGHFLSPFFVYFSPISPYLGLIVLSLPLLVLSLRVGGNHR